MGLFKRNPLKKLEKEYDRLLEAGMLRQRNGDIQGYARLSEQAEEVRKKIEALKAEQ